MFFEAASRLMRTTHEAVPVTYGWSGLPDQTSVTWNTPVPINDGSNLNTLRSLYVAASKALYLKLYPRPDNPALDEILAEY